MEFLWVSYTIHEETQIVIRGSLKTTAAVEFAANSLRLVVPPK